MPKLSDERDFDEACKDVRDMMYRRKLARRRRQECRLVWLATGLVMVLWALILWTIYKFY